MTRDNKQSMDSKFAIVPISTKVQEEKRALEEEGIDLNADSAFLSQSWEIFAKWRAKMREGKNLLLQRSMAETDELIAECMRQGILGDEEKMLEYMSLLNNYTGMMHRIKQINTIVQFFKKNYKSIVREIGNGSK